MLHARVSLQTGARTNAASFFERLFVGKPTVDVFLDRAKPPMLTCNGQSQTTTCSSKKTAVHRLHLDAAFGEQPLAPLLSIAAPCCRADATLANMAKVTGLECQHRSSSSTRHTFGGHRITDFLLTVRWMIFDREGAINDHPSQV